MHEYTGVGPSGRVPPCSTMYCAVGKFISMALLRQSEMVGGGMSGRASTKVHGCPEMPCQQRKIAYMTVLMMHHYTGAATQNGDMAMAFALVPRSDGLTGCTGPLWVG